MQSNQLLQNSKQILKKILQNIEPLKLGNIIKGQVIAKEKTMLFIDLGIYGIGIVYGQEFYNAKNLIKDLKVGDEVSGTIVDVENEDGYIELSLKQGAQKGDWEYFKNKMANKEAIEGKVVQANKGGLMLKVNSKIAFLPVSQLTNEHYPRVDGGDKNQILNELRKFIGQVFKVAILDIDPKEDKLIVSEKEVWHSEIEKILKQYKVGDVVDAEVRGVADFGIFVKILNTNKDSPLIEGLVHISELDWQLIENPHDLYKVGDKVKAKIISIDDGRISLSIKQLKPNPWDEVEKKYKKGQIVKGRVVKFNSFGAFVKLDLDIQGLVHVSEFGSEEKMKEKLSLNKVYDFQIVQIEPKNFKMALKLAEEKKKK